MFHGIDSLIYYRIELFCDLIFVGAITKTGHFIERGKEFSKRDGVLQNIDGAGIITWSSFAKFVMAFVPIIQKWRSQTALLNHIRHKGALSKLFNFILMSLMVLMSVSIENLFDLSPQTNSANVFIASHLLSTFAVRVYGTTAAVYNHLMFLPATHVVSLGDFIAHIPLMVLLAYQPTGTVEREQLREYLWSLGIILELLSQPIYVALMKALKLRACNPCLN
jgi:low temperature requirement protein LtrA